MNFGSLKLILPIDERSSITVSPRNKLISLAGVWSLSEAPPYCVRGPFKSVRLCNLFLHATAMGYIAFYSAAPLLAEQPYGFNGDCKIEQSKCSYLSWFPNMIVLGDFIVLGHTNRDKSTEIRIITDPKTW